MLCPKYSGPLTPAAPTATTLWEPLPFFSSAVFEENVKVLSFSNISVITEDIYLKLRVVVHYQKGNPYQ